MSNMPLVPVVEMLAAYSRRYTYEELKAKKFPPGLDITHLEVGNFSHFCFTVCCRITLVMRNLFNCLKYPGKNSLDFPRGSAKL